VRNCLTDEGRPLGTGEKLEAENRRLKNVGISALLLASTVLLTMGQVQTSKVIEAKAFHLKDSSGNVRARLDMSADRPTLTFLTAKNSGLLAIVLISAVSLAGTASPLGRVDCLRYLRVLVCCLT
jgi:hypothetical protein